MHRRRHGTRAPGLSPLVRARSTGGVRWGNLEGDGLGRLGLDCVVDATDLQARRPPLHVQAGAPGYLRLMAARWPVAWFRIEGDHYGYHYARRGLGGASPGLVLPPISAAEVREVAGAAGSDAWSDAWSRRFMRGLLSSVLSPLHAGRWWMARMPAYLSDGSYLKVDATTWLPPVAQLGRFADQRRHDYTPWDFCDDPCPLALRDLSLPSDGRVKAWRRACREGTLPPVLVQWVSGICRYVVLDGHDRLLAALEEGQLPQLLALFSVRARERQVDPQRAEQVSAIVQRQLAAAGNPELRPGRAFRVETANRLLVEAFDDRPHVGPTSRAWPLDGGVTSWRREVEHELAGKSAEAAEVMRAMLVE